MTQPTDQDLDAAERYADIDPPFAADTYELTNRQRELIEINAFIAGAKHGRKAERARCAEIAEFPFREKWTGYTGQSVRFDTAREIEAAIRAGEKDGK